MKGAPCQPNEAKPGNTSADPSDNSNLSLFNRTATQNDCDAYANSNSGCGVLYEENSSFGPPFNSNGGGWYCGLLFFLRIVSYPLIRYAIERTASFIKIWFWSKGDSAVPSEVVSGGSSVDTDTWVRSFDFNPTLNILPFSRRVSRRHIFRTPIVISPLILGNTASL